MKHCQRLLGTQLVTDDRTVVLLFRLCHRSPQPPPTETSSKPVTALAEDCQVAARGNRTLGYLMDDPLHR